MANLNFKTILDFSPVHQAFKYQQEAFEAIKDLEYCAILHEQGLGKTKIALDLILYWLSENIVDSAVLVVKKGLLANWKKEIEAHTNLKPKVIGQNRSDNYNAFNSPARLYLTHFEAIKAEKSRFNLFLKTRDVGVVIDEVQKIKNPNANLTSAFFEISDGFKRKAVMTGTIIANRPYDIWAPIYFLDAGRSLGKDFDKFKSEFDFKPSLATDEKERVEFQNGLEQLFSKISSFSVRETKDGAGIDLPSKEFTSVYCDWETIQYELYSQFRDEYRAVIEKDGLPTVDEAEGILKRLLRLVQIASNPTLVDSSYNLKSGKFVELGSLVSSIVDAGEKAIVWTSFTQNADFLHKELSKHGAVKLHGKMDMSRRNESVESFLKDETVRILVATPGAAKEGLTLTVANHVIFYDRSFSLDDYLQSQDRIHRISQNRKCYVYNLIMKGSADEWVDILLKEKELAARLGQGDIDAKEFEENMKFNMFDMLKSVLNIKPEGNANDMG